jgi:hypothetical protein
MVRYNHYSSSFKKNLFVFKDSLEITAVAFVVVNNNCSTLAVGWDKHVNIFNDDQEQIKQICFPDDQLFHGGENNSNEDHQEDILCIDKSQGDLIATGDYGGKIIITNMSSKKILVVLKEKKEENQNDDGKKYIFE